MRDCGAGPMRKLWVMAAVASLVQLAVVGGVVAPIRPSCQQDPGEDTPVNRVNTTERLEKLRQQMTNQRYNLAAYIIPMDDEHQSEYVSPHDARVRYISGFSGSAGLAVVTLTSAALWTDGRYFLQAENQLDCNWQLMKNGTHPPPPTAVEWLVSNLPRGSSVGADPRVVPANKWIYTKDMLADAALMVKPIYENLIDLIWTEDRPKIPEDMLQVHDLVYAGKPWREKVQQVREYLEENRLDALVVTALDEVAWLFNLRGNDIPHTPVFRSYAVVDFNSVHMWVNLTKVDENVRLHLQSEGCQDNADCVQLHNYDDILYDLAALVREKWKGDVLVPGKSSFIDGASFSIYNQVAPTKRVFVESPIVRMKGKKNDVEIEGMRNANLRDSVALCQFLAFLEREVQAGEKWDELSASQKVAEYRSKQELFRGTSFETISSFGSNAAVIHYAPTNKTTKVIDTSSTYLLDSGGQYLDGTTDVTRTVHFGQPTDFQREAYTRVLMGVIDLASMTIDSNVNDVQLGTVARRYLFEAGLNYRHGTGHGIGSYLCIHEGPTLISMSMDYPHLMEEGQFFSDEPGYYHDGEFGVRLETILYVKQKSTPYNFIGPYYEFEPVTLVPFEPNLILPELLSKNQLKWLNAYHRRVADELVPILELQKDQLAMDWIRKRTEPIRSAPAAPAVGLTRSADTSPSHQVSGRVATVCAALVISRFLM